MNGKQQASGFEAALLLGMAVKTLKSWTNKQANLGNISQPPKVKYGVKYVPCYPAAYLAEVIEKMKIVPKDVNDILSRLQGSKITDVYKVELEQELRDRGLL